MAIIYQSEGTNFPAIKRRKLSRWIKQVASLYGKKVDEIAYIFCSDNVILKMNLQYLQHNYYTDIITFDYSENNTISGDIFISVDTVKSNAKKFETDFEQELNRVIIHGILHLCGLKDETEEEKNMMREKENEALSLMEKIGEGRGDEI